MRATSQETETRQEVNLLNNLNSEGSIWEESFNFGGRYLFFGLLFIFMGIILAPIGLFIFLPFGIYLIYYPKRHLIKFTDSHLIIRLRLLGKTRKLSLSKLYKVSLIISKRKIYYHSDSGTYNAILKFKLIVLASDGEYKYKFTWIHHKRRESIFGGYREAKEEAIRKRRSFEQQLKQLQIIFPNLITFIDDYPKEKQRRHEKKMRKISDAIFFLLILSSVFISVLKNDVLYSNIFFIEIIIFVILIFTRKRDDTEGELSTKKDHSLKNILISIITAILALVYAIIMVNVIGYVLLFFLQSIF